MTTQRQVRAGAGRAVAWAVVAALVPAVWAAPAAGQTPPKDRAEEIARLVEQLGADSYQARQEAQRKLIEIGEPAVAALEKALKSSDAEVRMRAEKALEEIRKGAFGRTSEAMAKNLLWKLAVSGPLTSPPIVTGSTVVFAAYGGKLQAVSADKGKAVWEFQTHAQAVPALSGGRVYVQDAKGLLRAVDVRTGKPIEGFQAAGAAGPPVAGKGLVYVAGDAGDLLALDAASGRKSWAAELSEKAPRDVPPAVGAGLVFVADADGAIRAFDAANGKRKWAVAATTGRVVSLTFHEGLLIVRSDGGAYGFEAATGKARWQQTEPIDNAAGAGQPGVWARQVINVNGQRLILSDGGQGDRRWLGVFDDTIYLSGARQVAAVDAKTGTRKWAVKPQLEGGEDEDGGKHMVVVQGGGAAVQVMVGGNMIAGGSSASLTPAAAAGGTVFFGSREGLHAVDARTGRELWKLKTDEPVSGVPVVAGGVVYFSTGLGLAHGGLVFLQGGRNAPPARLGGSLRALKLTATRP